MKSFIHNPDKPITKKIYPTTALHSVPMIVVLVTIRACVIVQGSNMGQRSLHRSIHVSPIRFLKDRAIIFFSTGEKSSQPNKHSKKLSYWYFWLWRPRSLTHSVAHSINVWRDGRCFVWKVKCDDMFFST